MGVLLHHLERSVDLLHATAAPPEMQSVLERAKGVFAKLHSQHATWRGLGQGRISDYLGGDSELSVLLSEHTGDGEIALEDWVAFVRAICERKGVSTARFFLRHLERVELGDSAPQEAATEK